MEINTLSSYKSEDTLFLQNKKRRISPYQKVENEKRIRLCELVFVEGFLLKNAARELNINYSTAKTIVRNFKLKKSVIKKIPNVTPSPEDVKEENSNERIKELNLVERVFNNNQESINQRPGNNQITLEQYKEFKEKIKITTSQYKELVKRMDTFFKLVCFCFNRFMCSV